MEIAQVIDARVSEILYLIRKQLEESNYLDGLSAGIVLTGGGLFNIKGILEVAQGYFEVPVRLGYPNYIGVANPIYSAAAGIAMYTLKNKRTSSIISKSIHEDSLNDDDTMEDEYYESEKKSFSFGWLKKVKDFFAELF